ncbi:hypothetical protein JOB18_030639 [Solea senegalensis]|nr:hypothetical protein JOB18_030639 [Solea senegalensis]
MIFSGRGQTEVTGILGGNVTLQFTFHCIIHDNCHFAIYWTGHKKIAEYSKYKGGRGVFDIYQNTSVGYHMTNLTQNHAGLYWACLFSDSGTLRESNKVQLIVQVESRGITITDSPLPTYTTTKEEDGSSGFSPFVIITVLVASSVVLLAVVFLLLI